MKILFRNITFLFVGNIGARILTVASMIFLARFIGPKDYGVFAIAIAIANIAAYLTDLGISATYIREATKKKIKIGLLVGNVIKIRIVFSIFVSIFAIVVIPILYKNTYILTIINWILYPAVIGTVFQGAAISFFQAKEQMKKSSLLITIQGFFLASGVFISAFCKWPLTILAPIYGMSYLLSSGISLIFLLKNVDINFRGWNKRLLNQLFAYTINGIVLAILPQLGPIVLERVASLDAVGYFAIAYKIPSTLYQIPGIVATAFFPRLFMLGNAKELKKHRRLSILELKIMSFVGILIALPFILYPRFWIINLFGVKWSGAASALATLSYVVIFQSINYPLADYLTTVGKQYTRMAVMCVSLITGFISYATLGAKYGLIGGSLAPILIELVTMIGLVIFIKRGINYLITALKVNLISFVLCTVLAMVLPSQFSMEWMLLLMLLYVTLTCLLDKSIFLWISSYVKAKINGKVNN